MSDINNVHVNCLLIKSSHWQCFCKKALCRVPHRKHTKGNGKILVAGKRLNLGVRGPGEKPSWGRQDRVVPGVATLDRSPDQSPGVRPISPSH